MTSVALVLTSPSEVDHSARLARVLRFFGLEPTRAMVADFVGATASGDAAVLCTATAFTELLTAIARDARVARAWREKVASAFVFAVADEPALLRVAEALTSSPSVSITEVKTGAEWSVTGDLPEICRSLTGLKLTARQSGFALRLEAVTGFQPIISAADVSAFGRVSFDSVPVYLSTADIIDIDAPLRGRYFDIRHHLLDSAPIVLYVRAAFGNQVWTTSEARACLVIDDPLLKPRYGFVRFANLLAATKRADFATSVAFIPWNWRRSAESTVRLFRAHPDRLSVSVHGSDHTSSEFGSLNRDWLAWKASQAAERMRWHQARTGVAHDRVMIFPQGVFSATAMDVLKHGPFIGVVNTEVLSTEPVVPPISVADYWSVAVMRYSGFPIYTRRYPAAGVENFAFDILLGKPCIVVVHHHDCAGDFRDVIALIDRLNALNTQLRWSPLEQVIGHSYSERVRAGESEVRLFARVATLSNTSLRPRKLHVVKQESEPEAIADIRAAGTTIPFVRREDGIELDVTIPPKSHIDLVITFKTPSAGSAPDGVDLRYKAKVLVRRQLCEVRDNYLVARPSILQRTRRSASSRSS